MKFSTNKAKVTSVIFVLVLTFSAILVAFPSVGAHDPPLTVPTWAYISASNNPIGVGQQTVIVYWPNALPPTGQGAYGDRWTWTIEVTKPDASKETLGPWESDPVGGGWTTYTPDQVGTYTFVAIMDDHVITGEPAPPAGAWGTETIGDTYLGDTSDPYYLTVQEDPIESWPETPLPTEYWTRPINTLNREWYRLAGNWLAGAAQDVGPTTRFCYGLGPESAHVMWATPMWAGGIMDERFGNIGYATGHYEGIDFKPPIILNGKIYYNVMSLPMYGWYCLDLYTGKVDYFHNTTGPITGIGNTFIPGMGWVGFDGSGAIIGEKLAFGQIYNYASPNQHGGMPYLWSTPSTGFFASPDPNTQQNWMMFDAYTGNYICSIANASNAGTAVYGKDGSILRYNILGTPNPAGPFFPSLPPFYLQVWNTSRAIWYEEEWQINEYWMWRPVLNMTYDGNNGYSLNVTIPAVSGDILAIREGEFIIGGTGGTNKPDVPLELGNLWCLSLEPGQEGTLLWNRTFTPPYDEVPSTIGGMFGGGGVELAHVDPEDGVFLFSSPVTREHWGFSLDTMEMLWGPSEPEGSMNYYGMYENIYQGKLLSTGWSGELLAYNITTGKVLWKYSAPNVGYESPYGNYPINIAAIADGKIYMISGEHSVTQPPYRGPNLRCIDAETGDEVWKVAFFGADGGASLGGITVVMADGYVVGLNYYDNQIYCLGKGPSSTTVTASPKIIANGNSVMIEGTVTDQSPGTKTTEIMAKSPNAEGVPAIADEYQEDWMEYLYMQQAIPVYFEGVEVSLDAVDPNGNFVHIDTVRSDMSGMFKKMWTPDTEGEYTIMATFGGSKAYYSSYAETAVGVGPAPAPIQPIEPEAPTEAPFITTEIAIIIAVVIIAIIGIVAYWQLKKRK